MKLTPMLEQYLRAKQENPQALLFFRLGDFYELFFEDAETAAPLLDLTLTTRSKKDEVPIPMCGVPHHSVQSYIAKALAAGFKVALCDQMEDASVATGLVARQVVRVITPGTVTEEEYLDPKQASYLAALSSADGECGLVAVDVSTGELRESAGSQAEMLEELARIAAREVVVADDAEALEGAVRRAFPGVMVSTLPAARFDHGVGAAWLSQLAPQRAASASRPVLAALGAALAYLGETHRSSVAHLRAPEESARLVGLDEATRRNLELLATTRGEHRGSLLSVIDETRTPMGGRLLRQWLIAPLTDIAAIGARLDAVEELTRAPSRREDLARLLGKVGDLERLNARLAAARVTPRDLTGLVAALETVGAIADTLADAEAAALREARSGLDDLPRARERIAATLADDPPLQPRAGGLVRAGYDAGVDELRDLAHHGKRFISELEAAERRRTGIASLKVRYNHVFGYSIEVTRPNLHLVPADYRRKQTLANAERFVTAELEAQEAKVIGAQERLEALEAQIFAELVAEVGKESAALGRTAAALARADVFASFALVAERHAYTRPLVTRARTLTIEDGRHPVVEAMAGRERFVPNECRLDPDDQQILILTGPNMAGKSTYLRQVALIVLLAQIGSFVPAARAEIGVFDRIFTRIGASDNLAGGESTFMVEMKETAGILRDAAERNLIVLDEIGRGTSTFDGISIAWAVAEFLHDHAPGRPLVLFATHYHELTDLPRSKERVRNFSVAVREWKGEVLFLRRIVPGAASQSYGIQVARLAGVPESVVARAKQILGNLERGELTDAGFPRLAQNGGPPTAQLPLFSQSEQRLSSELASIDVDRLTPVDALTRLNELVQLARRGG